MRREELEVGSQHGDTGSSSRAQSSAVPPAPACVGSACAQSSCTEMHLLSACHSFQVVGRSCGAVVNTFPYFFPTAISTPLSRVVDLKL